MRWALKNRDGPADWYKTTMTILEVDDEDVAFGIEDGDEGKLQHYLSKLKERKEVYLEFFKKAQMQPPVFSDYKQLLQRPLDGE